MRTALDSSVILDVLCDSPANAGRSERAILDAFRSGLLVIGECVLAEISPALPGDDLSEFLSDWNIEFIPSSKESAMLAGQMYRAYLQRTGAEKRVLPDFLIGAHAITHTDQLLARDRGYYRDYFKNLPLIEPTSDR